MRLCPVLLLLATACTVEPAPAPLDQAAPPVVDPEEMLLESGEMTPGQPFTLSVTHAIPGDPVFFGYSLGGLGSSPPLGPLGGLQLALPSPQLVPGPNPATADANGEASIQFTIPAGTPPGFTASVQAAVAAGPGSYLSNPLVVEVGGCAEDGNEDDDDWTTANAAGPDQLWHGRACAGDRDWYAIDAPAGSTVLVDLEFPTADGDLDLFLFDGAPTDTTSLYTEAAVVADTTTDNELISYDVPASTTLYLAVERYSDGANGPGNQYDMHFTVSAGDLYADEPAPRSPADLRAEFDALYPPSVLSTLGQDLVDDFLAVEDAILAEDFVAARAAFDAINRPWSQPQWLSTTSWGSPVNVGSPVGYYGLRMLEEILVWRESNPASTAEPVRMTVVLPGCAEGVQPRTTAELQAGTGVATTQTLDPAIQADDYRIVRQSLRVFRRYMEAASQGTLRVEIDVVELPGTCVQVPTPQAPRNNLQPSINNVWNDMPAEVTANTDWWWIVYPSTVPDQYPDFATTEFVSGGQYASPQGGPAIVGDDRWLTDKPLHLGSGTMTDLERRMYLPQWLQHEFFHFLFSTWPQFGLEDQGHQWFDRSTWPADFVGTNEPDYYAEALHKRLQTATPPMSVALRFDAPDPALIAAIDPTALVGTYVRQPEQNPWHRGSISQVGNGYRWTNTAGVSWDLAYDAATGELRPTGSAPYGDSPFVVALERDADGVFQPSLEGLRFLGELYVRQ